MANTIEQALRDAHEVDRELRSQLGIGSPLFGDTKKDRDLQSQLGNGSPLFKTIEDLIKQLRLLCEKVLFLDFAFATQQRVGPRLWDSHGEINKRFRKLVDHHNSKSQAVEKRTVLKHYADFIKNSQFFYKGYIQRLASHFSGLHKLRKVAQCLDLSGLSVDRSVMVSPAIEQMIADSCYETLLHLGDLSRYRNSMRTKDASWDAAIGYYNLAHALDPDSGSAYNQIAVIYMRDEKHLDAILSLYRALAVKKPHPLGRKNLEVELRKVHTHFEKLKQASAGSHKTTGLLFARLQAEFYRGAAYSKEYKEIEDTILHRISDLLEEFEFEQTLAKWVLINLAAVEIADQRVRETTPPSLESLRSYYSFMRFNVRLFGCLLDVLSSELGKQAHLEGAHPMVTCLIRRITPPLRQYIAWFAYNSGMVAQSVMYSEATEYAAPVVEQVRNLFKKFADAMSKLWTLFPYNKIIPVDYLLPEDELTVGFKPLCPNDMSKYWCLFTNTDGNTPKPRLGELGAGHARPENEMLSRFRDICEGAVIASNDADCPVMMTKSTTNIFIYAPDVHPSLFELKSNPQLATPGPRKSELVPSKSTSSNSNMTKNLQLARTGLSSNDETSYGMHSATACEVFDAVRDGFQAQHAAQDTSHIIGSLPGIINTAFTPQANELGGSSHQSMKLETLPLQFGQQRSIANRRHELAEYGSSNPMSRRGSQPNTASPQLAQPLQETVVSEYFPQSSNFSNTSSIYAGSTPALRYNAPRPAVTENANNTTRYSGGSTLDNKLMMQSSLGFGSSSNPRGSQLFPNNTPPAGQGR